MTFSFQESRYFPSGWMGAGSKVLSVTQGIVRSRTMLAPHISPPLFMHSTARLLPRVLLVLTACPPQGPADLCNSREEALRSRECQLTPGVPLTVRYLSFARDTDWYSVRMPSTVGIRSVLRVTASYAVSSTPVNLSVRVLLEDGSEWAPRRVDVHGEGEPHPVEFLLPFSEPGARLLVQLDRMDYGQADYTLRTAYTGYPRTYSTLDGGSASCPRPEGDGGVVPGCVFTRPPVDGR
ncbi:MAG TPA: hypothetical protein VEU33_51935 [Archangium sp.]|nr:hypothetical protein [Archangium sp.]